MYRLACQLWRGVYAGPETTCPFAQNVEANYTGLGADYAYSPVTGEDYTMNCVAGYGNLNGGDSVVCRIASGWLPLATAHWSQSAMIPETKSSHRSPE